MRGSEMWSHSNLEEENKMDALLSFRIQEPWCLSASQRGEKGHRSLERFPVEALTPDGLHAEPGNDLDFNLGLRASILPSSDPLVPSQATHEQLVSVLVLMKAGCTDKNRQCREKLCSAKPSCQVSLLRAKCPFIEGISLTREINTII